MDFRTMDKLLTPIHECDLNPRSIRALKYVGDIKYPVQLLFLPFNEACRLPAVGPRIREHINETFHSLTPPTVDGTSPVRFIGAIIDNREAYGLSRMDIEEWGERFNSPNVLEHAESFLHRLARECDNAITIKISLNEEYSAAARRLGISADELRKVMEKTAEGYINIKAAAPGRQPQTP